MMQMNKTPFWGMPQQQPRQRAPSKVRVRTIPVHFVGSEQNRGDSATKIQKVLRGYLVRKSVKKMVAMKVELEQIEINVNAPETVEKMRKEKKERVRVGESIMNLLLRLDSVKVLHFSALRDCRKSLIKRAIVLQEMVDQIEGTPDHDQPRRTQEVGDSVADSSEMMAVADSAGRKIEALGAEEEKKMKVEEEEEDGEKGDCVEEESLVEEGCLVKEEEGQGGCEEHEEGKKFGTLREEEKMEEEEEKEEEGFGENCLVKEDEGGVVYDGHEQGKDMEALVNKEEDGVGEESVGTSLVEEEEGEEVGCEEEREKDSEDGNRELLKRMMQDNEKMMGMMAQLFEKNEKQTKLLSCLTQRVEMLERAFACDKLRRKKRRNADAKHRDHDPKNGWC